MATNDKKKGINTNSNVYTIIYAVVMVIIVAFLLAFVSSALKPTQDANVENDTKGQILTALGYNKDSVDVQKVFEEKVKDNVFEGNELKAFEGKFLSSYGTAINNGVLHVFVATTKDGKEAYVVPVVGRGLWGGLWGYIALSFETAEPTVLGTYFYHESETAGLGARIGEREFQESFIGKPIFENGKIALTVVKKGDAKKPTEVDGITGATLTSTGVGAMVKDGLTVYADFIASKTPTMASVEVAGEVACDEAACQGCPAEGDKCENCAGESCPKMQSGECCGKCCTDSANVEQAK